MKKIILLLFVTVFISCGESTDKEKDVTKKNSIEGFWNRIGTIRLVNGVPVDTLYIKNSDTPDYKQIKVFKDGNMIWLNNFKDSLSPWKGGAGGYGKFSVFSKDSLTEFISHGTGGWGAWVKRYKDSLNVPTWNFGLKTNISDNNYSQINGPESKFAEYWERMSIDKPKTKFDGAWKRVYEIAYINGKAVDTTAVPSDISLDIKIMSNGRYTYQVDMTGMFDSDEAGYGGYGGYGTFEYDAEKKILSEYQEWGSGGNIVVNEPMTSVDNHEINFYNDDMFIQISKTSVGVLQNQKATARGVVYRRIK